jgi:hypothetical protein
MLTDSAKNMSDVARSLGVSFGPTPEHYKLATALATGVSKIESIEAKGKADQEKWAVQQGLYLTDEAKQQIYDFREQQARASARGKEEEARIVGDTVKTVFCVAGVQPGQAFKPGSAISISANPSTGGFTYERKEGGYPLGKLTKGQTENLSEVAEETRVPSGPSELTIQRTTAVNKAMWRVKAATESKKKDLTMVGMPEILDMLRSELKDYTAFSNVNDVSDAASAATKSQYGQPLTDYLRDSFGVGLSKKEKEKFEELIDAEEGKRESEDQRLEDKELYQLASGEREITSPGQGTPLERAGAAPSKREAKEARKEAYEAKTTRLEAATSDKATVERERVLALIKAQQDLGKKNKALAKATVEQAPDMEAVSAPTPLSGEVPKPSVVISHGKEYFTVDDDKNMVPRDRSKSETGRIRNVVIDRETGERLDIYGIRYPARFYYDKDANEVRVRMWT